MIVFGMNHMHQSFLLPNSPMLLRNDGGRELIRNPFISTIGREIRVLKFSVMGALNASDLANFFFFTQYKMTKSFKNKKGFDFSQINSTQVHLKQSSTQTKTYHFTPILSILNGSHQTHIKHFQNMSSGKMFHHLVRHVGLLPNLIVSTYFPFFNPKIRYADNILLSNNTPHTSQIRMTKFPVPQLCFKILENRQD